MMMNREKAHKKTKQSTHIMGIKHVIYFLRKLQQYTWLQNYEALWCTRNEMASVQALMTSCLFFHIITQKNYVIWKEIENLYFRIVLPCCTPAHSRRQPTSVKISCKDMYFRTEHFTKMSLHCPLQGSCFYLPRRLKIQDDHTHYETTMLNVMKSCWTKMSETFQNNILIL